MGHTGFSGGRRIKWADSDGVGVKTGHSTEVPIAMIQEMLRLLEISYRSPWSNVEVSSHRPRTIGTSSSRSERSSVSEVKYLVGVELQCLW